MDAIANKDRFLCIENYTMVNGEIAFFKGKIYQSFNDGSLQSEIAKTHLMELNDEFYKHFEKMVK